MKYMKLTKLIIAGGFLGSGKTTLLWNAAQRLMKQGLRVGLITNDQAPELVDSTLLALNKMTVAEVSGSCFCCNFNGFAEAIKNLRANEAVDVIIAEPVGSCTDLSATIIQPLKQYLNTEVTVSPLSVLADPYRLDSILTGDTGGLHPDAAYILHKQLEESDIILINKADLLDKEQLQTLIERTGKAYPSSTIYPISAISGEGIAEWLEKVNKSNESRKRLIDVDYDIYANGEAVLGWLNGTITLKGENSNWDDFIYDLLSKLSLQFDEKGYSVGHVKIIAEHGQQYMVGNLTGTHESLSFRHSVGEADSIKLIINARVETSPETLNTIVRRTIDTLVEGKYETEIVAWRYLQPGRPEPTHRFDKVVVAHL